MFFFLQKHLHGFNIRMGETFCMASQILFYSLQEKYGLNPSSAPALYKLLGKNRPLCYMECCIY